jgi:hypothetical protein
MAEGKKFFLGVCTTGHRERGNEAVYGGYIWCPYGKIE